MWFKWNDLNVSYDYSSIQEAINHEVIVMNIFNNLNSIYIFTDMSLEIKKKVIHYGYQRI